MYNRLLNLYKDGILTEKGLNAAVENKFITEAQKNEIILAKLSN